MTYALHFEPSPDGPAHLFRRLNAIPNPNGLQSLQQVFVDAKGRNTA
jgi:hypothetical protein